MGFSYGFRAAGPKATMDRTVLIVDSDATWRGRIQQALREEPFSLVEAVSGADAVEQAKARPPDLLVTELDLRDVTGLGLIRLLREEPVLAATPIVVVTHFDREVDRIVAFEAGVDDYVTKPFFARELAGRIRAVLRRTAQGEGPHTDARLRRQGEVILDPDMRTVTVGDGPVHLTPREFDLLAVLMDDAGRVLSRARLVELVWGDDSAAGHRSVDTHVKTIRKKLRGARRFVETVRGVGYRFTER
jgi:DNA-binding response OmpR family regulator